MKGLRRPRPLRLGGASTPAPVEYTIVAGTPSGSDTQFATVPDFISVYADKNTWIARSSAGTGVAGDGTNWGRIFVAAGERRTLPWNTRAFWAVNATTAETPVVRAEAWF